MITDINTRIVELLIAFCQAWEIRSVMIWRGWGILVVAFLLGGLVSGEVIRQPFGWLLVAVANLILGWLLNRKARDEELGATYLHSFFGIAMEWWSLPMVGLAVFVWANNLQ